MLLFDKKRITQLEAELATERASVNEYAKENNALRNQVDFLIREIRKTDDIIFSIQQSADGNWKTVQPRFTQLCDQMTARKVAENNRISDLVTRELHSTYQPESKLLETKPYGQ